MNKKNIIPAAQTTPSKTVTISIDHDFVLGHAASFAAILSDLLAKQPISQETEHEKNIQQGICYLSFIIEDLLNGYLETEGKITKV